MRISDWSSDVCSSDLRHRGRGAQDARALRARVRTRMPALLRERARGAYRQLRTGAPDDLPRRPGSLDPLRTMAGTAGTGTGPRDPGLAGGDGCDVNQKEEGVDRKSKHLTSRH